MVGFAQPQTLYTHDINDQFGFYWTGTFGSTKDALPFIGTYSKTPHTYYALDFVGNGITFSVIAAEIICDMILGKTNKNQRLFSFSR